ncbi:MAG TPA: hypothetical protein VK789_22560 [Bryobacteraceae bacterium]|nr:hypothetical protein [Bryobacteraceae bacterium]
MVGGLAALGLLFLLAPAASADDYNVVQSWELGYRFATVGGNDGKYRADENYGDGIRLLSSNLTVNSKEGHGTLFDEIVLNTQGLGNDPYESATFRVQKNRIFDYNLLWRTNDYFNPGLTVANGEHLMDTTYRWQDHDLTLFPQSWFRLRGGYSRTSQVGPALTTEQEFNPTGDVFPLFRNLNQQFNEYRAGFDVTRKNVRFSVLRRWEYFKEDTTDNLPAAENGSSVPFGAQDPSKLTGFQRAQPYRGNTPGWMGNLFAQWKWIATNAHLTYAGGRGDFVQNQTAVGIDQFEAAQNQQVIVTGSGDRPVVSGNLNVTLFPESRWSVVNETSVSNTRMTGNNFFEDFNNATLSSQSLNFQFLGIRLVTNATDVHYKFSRKVNLFAGFRYSDRRIQSTEDFAPAGTPFEGVTGNQVNRLDSGVLGVNWLAAKDLRVHVEGEVGSDSRPFAPISQGKYSAIRSRVQYRRKNYSLGVLYQDNYNNNSIVITAYSSHARTYSADGSWNANSWLSVDASYSKLHLDTIGGITFFAGPVDIPLSAGAYSLYISNIHAANLSVRLAAAKRADIYLGYNITKDTGDGRGSEAQQASPAAQVFYNVQTFPLTFETPYARISIKLTSKIRYNVAWQYYGYHEQFGVLSENQNYRAHTGYTSLQWSF